MVEYSIKIRKLKSKSRPNDMQFKREKHDYTGLPKLNFGSNKNRLEHIAKFRKADTKRTDELDKLVPSNQLFPNKKKPHKSNFRFRFSYSSS